jgi:hypothetical protein
MEEDRLLMPANISDNFKIVLQKMLAVRATHRYQNVVELKRDMQAYGLLAGETNIPQQTPAPQSHAPKPYTPPKPYAPPVVVQKFMRSNFFAWVNENKLPAALIAACLIIILSVVIYVVAN